MREWFRPSPRDPAGVGAWWGWPPRPSRGSARGCCWARRCGRGRPRPTAGISTPTLAFWVAWGLLTPGGARRGGALSDCPAAPSAPRRPGPPRRRLHRGLPADGAWPSFARAGRRAAVWRRDRQHAIASSPRRCCRIWTGTTRSTSASSASATRSISTPRRKVAPCAPASSRRGWPKRNCRRCNVSSSRISSSTPCTRSSRWSGTTPTAAEQMIERLSDLLRVTLKNTATQEVPLAEELAYLEKYLAIEKVHFGDRLAGGGRCPARRAGRPGPVPGASAAGRKRDSPRPGAAPRARTPAGQRAARGRDRSC